MAEGIPQWADVASQLPADLPDSQREAIANGFFENQLWPALMKQGAADPIQRVAAKTSFLQQYASRADQSENPKLRLAGAAAVRTLMAPGSAVAQMLNGPEAANKYVDSMDQMTRTV